ncbi:MAG TPA: hypothetical protein VGF48_04345 [Thermoanaerobaculia bacterium]|jgi:hypothetical protein
MRRWTRAQFLELLDDEDLRELWPRWSLPDAPRRDHPAFLVAVESRSHSTLLHEILALRTPTLEMLHDVFVFLEGHGASVRTTGGLLVLDEDFEVGPQQVNAALGAMRRHAQETWEELRTRLRREVEPFFERVERVGRVLETEEEEDLVEVYIRARTGGSPEIRRWTIARYDEAGLRQRRQFVQELADLVARVRPHAEPYAEAVAFVDALDRLHEALENRLRRAERQVARADRRHSSYSDRLAPAQIEVWKRFAESLLFLADVEESAEVVDLLRMDLFRKRPQLYEIWIVVTILRFFERHGWTVELLGMIVSDSERTVWNLNYAKSSRPVARLVRGSDGDVSFLFYQLFRPGPLRAEMPDVAMLPSADPMAQPIWILDPKHSERGGYGLRDYEEVALRYHRTFVPRRTWIVEYYDRSAANPLPFADGVALIHAVAPGECGTRILLAALADLHGVVATMAIIDLSGSYAANVESVLEDLRGELVADEAIWFGDVATVAPLTGVPPNVGGGTNFRPVLELLEQLANQPAALRIYTDGSFSDIPF